MGLISVTNAGFLISVLFEPTDFEVSVKPFQTEHWGAIKFITPNVHELRHIAEHFGVLPKRKYDNRVQEVVAVASKLVEFVDTIIVTLGVDGVIVARKGAATESLLSQNGGDLQIRQYVGDRSKKVVSVSGAGDNLASGIIAGMLDGLSEEESVSVGLCAAEYTIGAPGPVPPKLFGKNHPAWRTKAAYRTLM